MAWAVPWGLTEIGREENKDKKTSETEEDLWRKRKAGDEGEGNPRQVETGPGANRSGPLKEKKVPEDCLFSFQLMKLLLSS